MRPNHLLKQDPINEFWSHLAQWRFRLTSGFSKHQKNISLYTELPLQSLWDFFSCKASELKSSTSICSISRRREPMHDWCWKSKATVPLDGTFPTSHNPSPSFRFWHHSVHHTAFIIMLSIWKNILLRQFKKQSLQSIPRDLNHRQDWHCYRINQSGQSLSLTRVLFQESIK